MNAFQDLSLAKTFTVVLASWTIFVTAQALIKAYKTPLSGVPGPWVAKFTKLWLMRAINTRSWEKINVRLHRQYGEFEVLFSCS